MGSSFEQTMMGWSPQCYIPTFVEISPPVPEKSFEGFLPYMASDFHFLVLESFHKNFGSDRQSSF